MAHTFISRVVSFSSHQGKLQAPSSTPAEQTHGVVQRAGPELSSYPGIDKPAPKAMLASCPNKEAKQTSFYLPCYIVAILST